MSIRGLVSMRVREREREPRKRCMAKTSAQECRISRVRLGGDGDAEKEYAFLYFVVLLSYVRMR